MWERIKEDFDVFLEEGGRSFGAVRQVRKAELVIYVENAGDFEVPFEAVQDAGAGKVVLDESRLSPKLREAIANAHGREDPRI
jgi:hypothetical protein